MDEWSTAPIAGVSPLLIVLASHNSQEEIDVSSAVHANFPYSY